MIDTLLGNLRLVGGWLLDPRWLSSLEGPYTVLAKLQIVNAMSPQDLCGIFGVRSLDSKAVPLHGRSLLDIGWARSKRAHAGELLEAVGARTLARLSDRWWRALGTDRRFRFCPSCIARGFQSVLCQLEGLTHCPVHGDLIVDSCLECGAATPRYAITQEAFEQPMTCRACGRPYADCWDRANRFGEWSEPEGTQAYGPIALWLRSINSIDCLWPDQSSWMIDPADDRSEHRKRACMLGLMSRLRAAPFEHGGGELSVQSFDLPEQQVDGLGAGLRQPNAGRRQVYKSIRRHYRAVLGASHRKVWQLRDDLVWDYPHTVVMPANRHVGAEMHAFLCWRARFENAPLNGEITTRRGAPLEIRFELLHWPMSWHASDRAWGHFVQFCLTHELDQAREVHEQLDGLDMHCPGDLAAWLNVVRAKCHRFGRARQAWPAALTCLVLKSPDAGRQGQLVLVSATRAKREKAALRAEGKDATQ